MIASVLQLSRRDVRLLRITDAYSLHRVVYSLYEDTRLDEDKMASTSSGILFADQGGDFYSRRVLLLADRYPSECIDGQFGQVTSKLIPSNFLEFQHYRFKIIINPTRRDNSTRKIIPVKGREEITKWFCNRAATVWGFDAHHENISVDNIEILRFKNKHQQLITMAQAHLHGLLTINHPDKFQKAFIQGLGRGRAFGCGLLQISPLKEPVFTEEN